MTTAHEWLAQYVERNGIDYDGSSQSERLLLCAQIPCSIRCWRVGAAVDLRPGELCPECGKLEPEGGT